MTVQITEDSLANIEKASLLISQARNTDEALFLKSMFQAAEIQARKKGLTDIESKAVEYKLWTEDKLGALLIQMKESGERAKAGELTSHSNFRSTMSNAPKTLADLGISKNEASRYQKFHKLPEDKKLEIIEHAKEKVENARARAVRDIEYEIESEARKQSRVNAVQNANVKEPLVLYNEDFNHWHKYIQKESVDLIFTDPPYDRESLKLWQELAEMASSSLKKGGYLIAYSGKYHFGEVFKILSSKLEYYWICSIPKESTNEYIHPRNATDTWKVLLIFSKGEGRKHDGFVDSIQGQLGDKQLHEWAQGQNEAEYFIERFTKEGELVCDPMAGSGTTLRASRALHRKQLGFEIDKEKYLIAKGGP
ncbi:MAG: DNA methyltransferase [Nitrososphaerales archaeon]